MDLEPIILACCTLTLVLVGLGVVFFVALFPVVFAVMTRRHIPTYFPEQAQQLQYFAAVGALQWVHVKLLWYSPFYLMFARVLVYPVRKMIMPLVMFIVRLEFRKEREPAMYVDLEPVRQSQSKGDPANSLMESFRPSVRRRYRVMEKMFREKQITCKVLESETSLDLSKVVPVMIEHEGRCCRRDGKGIAEEFIKRFLVVVMTTNATLDQYYDVNNKLCSIQLSIQQGNVLHWFMYFSTNEASRCGIWYHGLLSAMTRGSRSTTVRFVNGQGHQVASKLSAGLEKAAYTDAARLSELYPWRFTGDIAPEALVPLLWLAD